MSINLTEDQRMIANSLAGAGGDWDALTELGLLGLTVSEAAGGAGLGVADAIPALAEAARSAPMGSVIAGAVLPGLAATALDLPHAGAIAGGRLRAVVALPANCGDLHVDGTTLSGRIEVLPGADTAELLILCLSENCATIALDSPGLTRDSYALADGQPAADLVLDKVGFVPITAPKGSAGRLQDAAALALCADALGAMITIREMTRDYIATRKQFGRAIGSFQALQHAMVDIYHGSEDYLSLVLRAAGGFDGLDRARLVSAAKRCCGTRMRAAAASAVQLHGGIGMTQEYALGALVRRVLVADMLNGSADDHAARLGRIIANTARREMQEETA